MSTSMRQKLSVLIFAGSAWLGAAQTGIPADGVVAVNDPYCEAPRYGWCDAFCYKFKLHCRYVRICCCQRYTMLPPSMTPYMGAADYCPNPYLSPTASMSYGAPAYGSGYAAPPTYLPPAPNAR